MKNELAIEFDQIHKIYGRGAGAVHALKDLSLHIERGQVFGFLGPNGAGKSTAIRLLMDLIRPSSGQVRMFGKLVSAGDSVRRRAGALVEGARFYDFLSGRQNLEVLARTANKFNPDRISDVLSLVGMESRSDRRAGGYSTGMKQRLGLAAALLADPELVILDEPTNGLDPGGIQEIRILIRTLVDRDEKTVFLSSHLLSEVEQVCDRVAIIHNGRILRQGKVSDLLTLENASLRLQVQPVDEATRLLRSRWSPVHRDGWLEIAAPYREVPAVVKMLVDGGVQVFQVSARRQSLEDFFLNVTQGREQPVSTQFNTGAAEDENE